MQVKDILDKLRILDEGDQADFERRDAISKLKKLTSGNEYNDANHTYINPKTGAIIYSRDGSPMPAKSFNDPKYDTASVGLELRQLLKQVGLPVTADARGNAMVDPAAFANLGNDKPPTKPEPFVPNPVGLDGTGGDKPPEPPKPPKPEPFVPNPVGLDGTGGDKPPEPPKPPEPSKPSIDRADPKDQDRFRELINKFKTYKKPEPPKPEPPKPEPPKPEPPKPEPAEEKKWPTTPDEIKAFQTGKDDPRQPGSKLAVDGMIGTHTLQALVNAGYKPPADFTVTAYKPTGGGTAPKPKPKPEIQPAPTTSEIGDAWKVAGIPGHRGSSLTEDDQILSMIKNIRL
jgi:hypothetical protein